MESSPVYLWILYYILIQEQRNLDANLFAVKFSANPIFLLLIDNT
jgi:hypothetical protein